ncbi:MAG: hypothetical protein LBM66_02820 [Bifidobacteriaceae bacterium]|nr:hypothetical protein [Bifidobacteriaceae bacterium]
MSIDIKIYEDLPAVAAFGSDLKALGRQADDWVDSVYQYRGQILESWGGLAALAFSAKASTAANQLDELASTAKTFAGAVADFHGAITKCQDEFQTMREKAQAVALPTSAVSIEPPVPPPSDDAGAWAFYETQLAVYGSLSEEAGEVRSKITDAHIEFDAKAGAVKAPSGITLKSDLAVQVVNFAGMSSDLAGDILHKALDEIAAGDNAEAFLQWGAGDTEALAGAGKLAKALNVAGIAPTALEAIEDAVQQWQRDRYDPTLTEAEKITRAVTVAGADTGISALTSYAGTKGGEAVGSAVLPGPGTVIGGITGGLAAQKAGEKMEGHFKVEMEEYINRHIR